MMTSSYYVLLKAVMRVFSDIERSFIVFYQFSLSLANAYACMSYDPQAYATKAEAQLASDVEFHVMFIEDILTLSLTQLYQWRQINQPNHAPVDRLGAAALRPIVDHVNVTEDEQPEIPTRRQWKLTLQDRQGHACFAYDRYQLIDWLKIRAGASGPSLMVPIPLGSRIVVKATTLIEFGVLQLEKTKCTYLGPDKDMGPVADRYISVLEHRLGMSSS